jgi:EamA domain-containing membrane protein RarD
MFAVVALLILLAIGIFLWLRSREQKRRGLSALPGWRLVLATIFSLVALFAGGCGLLYLPDALGGSQYIDPIAVLMIGGVPFLISSLLTWALLRRGTNHAQSEPQATTEKKQDGQDQI